MKIHSIAGEGFPTCKEFQLALPARGVVLVTGPNGAGKSSLFLDAPAAAFWNETLRGDPIWLEGVNSEVSVDFDAGGGASHVRVRRRRTAGKTVSLAHGAVVSGMDWKPVKYETTTKQQEVLLQLVGDFIGWRRTSVFSSADSDNWTRSTDGDRKRLLEALIGNDRFEPALEACRADLKGMDSRLVIARGQHAVVLSKLEGIRTRIADAEQSMEQLQQATSIGLDQLQLDVRKAALLVNGAEDDLEDLREQLAELTEAAAVNRGAHDSERRRLATLAARDECPTCEQPVTPEWKARLQKRLETAVAGDEPADPELEASLRAQLREVKSEREALEQRRSILSGRLNTARDAEQRRARAEQWLRSVQKEVADVQVDVLKVQGEVKECEQQVLELTYCDAVLGMKGVRAHLLGKALGGLELVANVWLGKIGGSLQLKLDPYTEKKTGGTSDSISLRVCKNNGPWRGYKSFSAGERRRVDVAALMALKELRGAALEHHAGTLWFDEVFDALDGVGVEGIASVLQELTKDRTAIVITHSSQLAAKLTAVLHYAVEAGQAPKVV